MIERVRKVKWKRIPWALFFMCLPVTSFPYFPRILGGGKVSVSPLLVYPLIILVVTVTLPSLWKQRLPKIWIPFILFVLSATFSSLLPFFRGFESNLREAAVSQRVLRSLITLAIAGAIYWTVSILPQKREDLKFILKWFYLGMGLALFWGSIQIIYVLDLIPGWYENMRAVQNHISIAPLFSNRISGMALEPSWFADQLAGLWLPWVLGAVLSNYSLTNNLYKKIKLEHILLIWLIFVLLFTLSRAGLGVALLVILFGVIFFGNKFILSIFNLSAWEWFRKLKNRHPAMVPLIFRGLVIICFLLAFFLAFYVVSTQSKYISRMWNFWQNQRGGGVVNYFRYIGFGPRFVYWWTAFRIFSHYPIFGVGLGNYTFHFTEFVPSVQIGYMPELIRRFVPTGKRIITSKNFFAHLLSETGFVGTSLFIIFLLLLLGKAVRLWRSEDEFEKFWGTSSILSLFAFIIDSFSFGSFAIPNPWINFGLITCTVFVFSNHSVHQDILGSDAPIT